MNPLLPRPKGDKDAEGMKKQIPSNNATALQQLGIDHTKLTYRFQGCDYRLTDVHGEVVKGVLA